MLDEEMDDIIKEAANQHHPPYDDKAWEKMKGLLDTHLPEKKDRRRPFIFLFTTLLLGGGLLFYLLKPSDKTNGPVAQQQSPSTVTKEVAVTANKRKENIVQTNKESIPALKTEGANQPALASGMNSSVNEKPIRYTTKTVDKTKRSSKKIKGTKGSFNVAITAPGAAAINEDAISSKEEKEVETADLVDIEPTVSEPAIAAGNNKQDTVTTTADKKTVTTASSSTKKKKGFADNFALTFSAGPDVSFVKIGDPGKLTIPWGAGLSYTIAGRLTIRSGFYTSQKIYTTNGDAYHPPAGYWTNYYDLTKVDADCRIYEIPLSLSYNFGEKRKHSWFGAAGISSFLMKRETYDYFYKNQAGAMVSKSWTIRNSNEHYFAVLTLSGGYSYHLNNRVSFLAEPYVKLPLKGVGFGKIKLNSSGLLLTAAVKPFVRKN